MMSKQTSADIERRQKRERKKEGKEEGMKQTRTAK